MRVRTLFGAVTLGLVALAGCQKLNHEQTASMDANSTKALLFDAPRYEQKVTVTVKPTGGAVAAYLCKAESSEKVERLVMYDKDPGADVFGSAKGKADDEEISFEATVPKQTEYALVLHNPGKKKIDLSIKVIGK